MVETRIPAQRIDLAASTTPSVGLFPGFLWYNTASSKLFLYNGVIFREYAEQADITSLQTSLTGSGGAATIGLVGNFSFSNSTDVQGVLDDVESNVYQEFLNQHNADGTHGPNVTLDNTGAGDALCITTGAAATGHALDITSDSTSSTSWPVDIAQNEDVSTIVVTKTAVGAGNMVVINNDGTGIGVIVNQTGDGIGLCVEQSGDAAAAEINTGGDSSGGIVINVDGTRAAVDIGLEINQTADAVATLINVGAAGRVGLSVDSTTTGSWSAAQIVAQGTNHSAAVISVTSTDNTQPTLSVANSGQSESLRVTTVTGDLITGANGTGTVFEVGLQGHVRVGAVTSPATDKTIDANGVVNLVASNVFAGFVCLIPNTGTVDDLEGFVATDDGAIVILKKRNASDTITVKHNATATGGVPIRLDGAADKVLNHVADRLTIQYDAGLGYWVQLAFSDNS